MKILITGAKGMLAQEIRARFAEDPDGNANELILTDREADDLSSIASLDITNLIQVVGFINEVKPELIINCAAYTNVDMAEVQEGVARKINALGPSLLAEVANKNGATLVHISTDYVFDGERPISPRDPRCVYYENDKPNPQTAYGRTKYEGESVIRSKMSVGNYYIFRTAWLYGKGGKNFVDTMINASKNGEVRVVNDQHGSPTYTKDLADIIYQSVYKQIPFGIYNATNEGFTTWADFTKKIYELSGINCNVVGISSAEYEAEAEKKAAEKGEKRIVAKRPLNSQMSKQKLLDNGITIRKWDEALKDYLGKE